MHLGDDYCPLAEDPPRVFALYRSMKLHPRSLDLDPLRARRTPTAWMSEDKNVLLVDEESPAELPLKIILLPRVSGGEKTIVRPATGAEALRALAPSSIFQLAGTSATTFGFFARLSKQLPAFHLELGADSHNVAKLVRELLEHATP